MTLPLSAAWCGDARVDDRDADALAVDGRSSRASNAEQAAGCAARAWSAAMAAVGHRHRSDRRCCRARSTAMPATFCSASSRLGVASTDDEAVEHAQDLDAVAGGGRLNRGDVAAHDGRTGRSSPFTTRSSRSVESRLPTSGNTSLLTSGPTIGKSPSSDRNRPDWAPTVVGASRSPTMTNCASLGASRFKAQYS